MSTLQIVFLVLTFALPLLLCGAGRWRASARFDELVARILAAGLVAAGVGEWLTKVFLEHLPWRREA